MNSDDLQARRELLKTKKRKLVMFYLVLFIAFISYLIIKASNRWPWFMEIPMSVVPWALFWWHISKCDSLYSQDSEKQIKKEEQAAWREGVIARIRSGELKPNPNLK